MASVSAKEKLGCWLHERWRAELVLRTPALARALGRSWLDLCNRSERLSRDPLTGGRVCGWQDSSRLTVSRLFPSVGHRLMVHALSEWPIGSRQVVPASPQGNPEIAFIVPFGGTERRPQLQLTLLAAMAQTGVAFEVIVVEQSESPTLPGTLPDGVIHLHQALPRGAEFNKSMALNLGVRHSRAELLVVLDADYLVPARFGAESVRSLAVHDAVRPARLIFYLDRVSTERLSAAGEWSDDLLPEYIVANNPTPLAVRRSVYEAIGGHDEAYWGWGGEDLEFLGRLRTRRVGEGGWMPVVHAWHPPAPRKENGDRNRALHAAKMAVDPAGRIAALKALAA